ncbi:hypothetical protein V8G54_034692 [Vigna mungo]|uniref:Uncharacterized protein n=1 Tax=Vigna mungo TaxID=3915 RepID=A0AAQ3R9A6_VIGMU
MKNLVGTNYQGCSEAKLHDVNLDFSKDPGGHSESLMPPPHGSHYLPKVERGNTRLEHSILQCTRKQMGSIEENNCSVGAKFGIRGEKVTWCEDFRVIYRCEIGEIKKLLAMNHVEGSGESVRGESRVEENFEVVIHHGGKFINEGKLNYEGRELWYCVGGGSVLENRLEPLLDDTRAMHMITLAMSDCMEGLVDVHVDCDIEEEVGDGVGNVEVDVQSDGPSWTQMSDRDVDDDINSDNHRGLSDDEWESEELDSGAESDGEDDEDEGYGKFVTFYMPETMVDYKWDLNTYFANKQDFVDAIKTYAVQNGRNIKYVKNDKKRIRLKCMSGKGECPWMAYCAYMEAIKTWQLRTIVDNHSCSREHKEWNVGVSRCMAYRAKAIASNQVDGSFKDQFKRIYDYANELLAHNGGSTVKVKVEDIGSGPIFKTFYTCLKACKDIFMSCRPIIGLNGAFWKGKYGGELLSVVGRDANDQMLALAYAMVEVENNDTWKWFLELLVEDLGREEVSSPFTFMSDQQKGLMKAIQEMVPRVYQCFCVWHLYVNFRKKIPGKQLKRLITTPQCDTLVNNMSEAFNGVLVHTRSKPIISMLKDIRLYLMKRWAINKSKIQSFSGDICPKIKIRLNKESQLTKHWISCEFRPKFVYMQEVGYHWRTMLPLIDCYEIPKSISRGLHTMLL